MDHAFGNGAMLLSCLLWVDLLFPLHICLLICIYLFVFEHSICGIWILEVLKIIRLNSTQHQQLAIMISANPAPTLHPCYTACDEVMNSWSFAVTLGTVYFDLVRVYLLAIPSIVPLLIRDLEANIVLCSLKLKLKKGLGPHQSNPLGVGVEG